MSPGKDDPLGQGRPRVTIWLDREHMEESREAYWKAYVLINPMADRKTWDTAYAAAVAAFDFLMAGKLRPG